MRLASPHAPLTLASSVIVVGVCVARQQAGRWPLTRFVEHDVAVEIALERNPSGKTWLVGTYTPARTKFHLYGKDLPKEGIHGVARPTLLELVQSTAIRPAGPLVADQPIMDLHVQELGLTFPVYPEGPVTLRLPVTGALTDNAAAEVSVTYMACSDRTCLAPVVDKRISLRIPATAP